MSRICQITGKKGMRGHKVSHSNKKTNRSFQPNLVTKTVFYERGGVYLRLKMSASAWRTMAKKGVSATIESSFEKGILQQLI